MSLGKRGRRERVSENKTENAITFRAMFCNKIFENIFFRAKSVLLNPYHLICHQSCCSIRDHFDLFSFLKCDNSLRDAPYISNLMIYDIYIQLL